MNLAARLSQDRNELIVRSDDWSAIFAPGTGLLIEPRPAIVPVDAIARALDALDRARHLAGTPAELGAALADLPGLLVRDIERLARRFAALMSVGEVRLRIERIETDACRKWHLDFTDLRLVVTYAGPGTQFRLGETGAIEVIGAHAVALFKGCDFAPCHRLIHHRSPPIAGTGVRRLVLVIDTPERERDDSFHLQSALA